MLAVMSSCAPVAAMCCTFPCTEFFRHFGLIEVVGSRRAAAHVAFLERDDRQPGNEGEQGTRGGADAVGVDEVTGVMIGDGADDLPGRGVDFDFIQEFSDVAASCARPIPCSWQCLRMCLNGRGCGEGL